MWFRYGLFGLAVCAWSALPCLAGTWSSKGELALESRVFSDDDQEETVDQGYGLFSRLETAYRQGRWRAQVRGYGRVDRKDSSRDLAELEEAWISYRSRRWEIKAGAQLLNWTATEAFHPADLVNSRNLDSNLENPEKLGEWMVSLRRKFGQGGLTLYYMPSSESPKLPGPSSRLNLLPGIPNLGEALWLEDEDSLNDDGQVTQGGFRFTQTMGDADFSVHWLDHLDRFQPTGIFDAETGQFRPVYSRVRDIGLTYLHIVGGLILKVEANHRDFITPLDSRLGQPDHGQFAFGSEYGWVFSGGGEGTLIFEGQSLFDVEKQQRRRLSAFQRDLLLGYRHNWNDALGRNLLVTTIFDVDQGGEVLVNAQYQQRLSDTWRVEVGMRIIDAESDDDSSVGLQVLDESNQISLKISRFF